VDGQTDVRMDGRTYLLMDGHFFSNIIRSTRRSLPKNL